MGTEPGVLRRPHYPFTDVYLEPKPFRPSGPTIWLGGATLHDRLLRGWFGTRDAFHPLGQPTDAELDRIRGKR